MQSSMCICMHFLVYMHADCMHVQKLVVRAANVEDPMCIIHSLPSPSTPYFSSCMFTQLSMHVNAIPLARWTLIPSMSYLNISSNIIIYLLCVRFVCPVSSACPQEFWAYHEVSDCSQTRSCSFSFHVIYIYTYTHTHIYIYIHFNNTINTRLHMPSINVQPRTAAWVISLLSTWLSRASCVGPWQVAPRNYKPSSRF